MSGGHREKQVEVGRFPTEFCDRFVFFIRVLNKVVRSCSGGECRRSLFVRYLEVELSY